MPMVRVVLAMLPPILNEILKRALSFQPDIAVVAEVRSPTQMLATIRRTAPDVIVALNSSQLEIRLHHWLREFPDLTIFTVPRHARSWSRFELRLYQTGRMDFAAGDLVEAVRSVSPLVYRPPLLGEEPSTDRSSRWLYRRGPRETEN